MMNEGNLVSKIDARIAELQALREFAVKNFPDEADVDAEAQAVAVRGKLKERLETVYGTKAKPAKKSASKATGDEAVKEAILTFLGEQTEPSKAEDVAEIVGVSGPALTAHLRELAEEKKVKRTGISRGTRWQLAK